MIGRIVSRSFLFFTFQIRTTIGAMFGGEIHRFAGDPCDLCPAFVSRPAGIRLLLPLVTLGVGSICWWHFTETQGHGDLRLYYWVQYYPMLALPLILWLFYTPAAIPILRCLVWVVA